MNRFEHAVHTARREEGELSVERFNELWADDADGHARRLRSRSPRATARWWSYIPHFISTPGYVYAYAYGQLLALSVYRRYELRSATTSCRSYLDLLRAGGSLPPEELGRIVDCDLADPAFWDGGLAIVDEQLLAAEEAAAAAGRV